MNISSYKKLYNIPEINLGENKICTQILPSSLTDLSKELDKDGYWITASKNKTFFKIKDMGTYLIQDGNKIFVDAPYKDHPNVDALILGLSCGLLMSQRKQIALHGSAIRLNDDKCLVLVGESGSGKSSLTSAFISRGYKFLSDDVSAISKFKNTNYVESSFPCRKICSDAMTKLNYNKNDFKLVDEDRQKYIVVDNSNFHNTKIKLAYLCEIVVSDDENSKVCIEEISSFEKINLITKHLCSAYIFLNIKIDQDYFEKILDIAKNTKCFKITRPKNKFSVYEQIDLIIKSI